MKAELYRILVVSGLIFILSYFLTNIYRSLALRKNLLDIPNERSSHESPTPKGGGLAIVVSFYAGIIVIALMGVIEWPLCLALLSGFILAIVGFIDDIVEIKPVVRLFVQLGTTLIALFFLGGVKPLIIGNLVVGSWYILLPLAVTGMVWFINTFNFLDGIDGYASLEAITVASLILILTGNPVCMIIIASTLGFLVWNWPRAKIFMGDVGSTQLGLILSVLGIYLHNQGDLSIINWIILTSLFWFDATLTLFRRWRNRERLSIAHKKHAYQRAVQSGLSHQQIILLSLAVNILLFGLVFISVQMEFLQILFLFVSVVLLYGITKLIDRKIPFV